MVTGMQFKAGRAELVAALESVRHVTDRKAWKPALKNCRFRADTARGGLSVAGTDLSTWIEARVGGSSSWETGGEMLVPLHDLLDFLKACEGETVSVEHRPEVVAVEGVSSAALISTSDGETLELPSDTEEYPVEPTYLEEACAVVGLPGEELARMLRSTIGSTGREPGRYAMHGVMLEVKVGAFGFRALATDGKRLAVATGTGCSLSGVDASGLLPSGAAEIVGKILAKNRKAGANGAAEVRVDQAFARFALPCGVSVTARMLEGEFPRVESVIPPAGSATVSVRLPVEETLHRLKLVSSACVTESRAVRFTVVEKSAVLSAASREKKSSARILEAMVEKGSGEIGFNPDFFADALTASGADEVVFGFRAADVPMRIDAGDGYFAVVMPITVSE